MTILHLIPAKWALQLQLPIRGRGYPLHREVFLHEKVTR